MDIFSSIRSRSIKLKSNNQSNSLFRSNTAEYGSLVWTFDPDNHYLSPSLTRFVYNKWTIRAVLFTATFIVGIGIFGPPIAWFSMWLILRIVLYIPYFTLLVLSFNRDARGFVLKTTEFWIKIVYGAVFEILLLILYHQVGRHNSEDTTPEWIRYTDGALACCNTPMFLAFVGGVDAIPKMSFKSKAFLIGLVAALYTFNAVDYQLLRPTRYDYTIEIKATDSELSLHSLLANVFGMLSLFLWKQMIDILRNKDRCVTIIYRPYLRWERPRNASESMEPATFKIETVVIQSNESALSEQAESELKENAETGTVVIESAAT